MHNPNAVDAGIDFRDLPVMGDLPTDPPKGYRLPERVIHPGQFVRVVSGHLSCTCLVTVSCHAIARDALPGLSDTFTMFDS